ncbi:hypothetical protein CEP53_014467 [Fusarium sp. AF-6]|nr:hypothetical protein CEP53_014467 [Fusarium sp. AF-6]
MSDSTPNTIIAPCLEVGDDGLVRQKPTAAENYQDSVVLVWWDPDNHIGGFHRLGHEISENSGSSATLWTNIVTPTGIFKRTQSIPLRKEDSLPGGGFGSGYDTYTKSSVTETFAAGHTDIPGTVTGTLTHEGKTYQVIKGLSIRDHGWGVRNWGSALLSHRWIVGTAGPDFSIVIASWHSADDQYIKFGWFVRNNIVTAAKAIDIVTYVEDESLSNRGRRTEVELVTGQLNSPNHQLCPSKCSIERHIFHLDASTSM